MAFLTLPVQIGRSLDGYTLPKSLRSGERGKAARISAGTARRTGRRNSLERYHLFSSRAVAMCQPAVNIQCRHTEVLAILSLKKPTRCHSLHQFPFLETLLGKHSPPSSDNLTAEHFPLSSVFGVGMDLTPQDGLEKKTHLLICEWYHSALSACNCSPLLNLQVPCMNLSLSFHPFIRFLFCMLLNNMCVLSSMATRSLRSNGVKALPKAFYRST
ncbi:hypothetical protein AXF42_Ash017697 [Apostasia shenzhenica]|uniref:Uncharacterized protein n=1 Tax=Apostasia shenzhenica TaxID=1088818 RepID=A0A2I0B606_9ASPA|nr:hypothetical protein AXF42_Ash017697 [Apostasia shenzhenica]